MSTNPFSTAPVSGSPQTTPQDYGQLYNAYSEYLPQVANANNAQQTPAAQAQLAAAQATQPGYQQLATNLFQGAGGQAATAGQQLNQTLNPNYYKTLGAASQGAQSALGAINLNGLSPGESNATERSLNQSNTGTGNLGLLNPTNTIANAMNFGGAFNSKIGLMNSAVGSATNVANTASENAGYSPTGEVLNNLGMSAATNPTTPFASTTGNAMLGGASGIQQAYISPQATSAYQNSPGGQDTAKVGSMCCFIFLESYNGTLPWYIRECRDYFYSIEPVIAKGYIRSTKVIVPLMKNSKIITKLVNKFMVKPISEYGAWLKSVNTNGYKQYPYKKFWFSFWKVIGSI